MKEILLIILLTIAILLDVLRIYQYIKLRKSVKEEVRENIINKVVVLIDRFKGDRTELYGYLKKNLFDEQV